MSHLPHSDTQLGLPTHLETALIEEVPTLERFVAEVQDMDQDIAAFVTECGARDIHEKLAAADIGKANQVNKTGKSKQDERERVRRVRNKTATMLDKAESVFDSRTKRGRDTRALSPIYCRQSRRPNVVDLDSSRARSHSAPSASSSLCPRFGTSNKVVPMYSQVHADIDSHGGASMTMTPHASLISEAQQCNMSIKIADGLALTSNIKRGFLDATCNGKLL